MFDTLTWDVEASDGTPLANVHGWESTQEDAEIAKANARLIAAAPELLAALQSLLLKLPDNSGYYQDAAEYRHIKSAVERADAAIAKATQP